MGLRRSRSSSSASMTRDMKGARIEASGAGAGEEREEEEEAAPAAPPPAAPPPAAAAAAGVPPAAAAGDDAVAGDDEAAGKASASISSFNSLALPKVRPKLFRSSTVSLTSALLVMVSFLQAACESTAHVAQHMHKHKRKRKHFNTRAGACSVLRT